MTEKRTTNIVAGEMLHPFDRHGMAGYEADLRPSSGKIGQNPYWKEFTTNPRGAPKPNNEDWDPDGQRQWLQKTIDTQTAIREAAYRRVGRVPYEPPPAPRGKERYQT